MKDIGDGDDDTAVRGLARVRAWCVAVERTTLSCESAEHALRTCLHPEEEPFFFGNIWRTVCGDNAGEILISCWDHRARKFTLEWYTRVPGDRKMLPLVHQALTSLGCCEYSSVHSRNLAWLQTNIPKASRRVADVRAGIQENQPIL